MPRRGANNGCSRTRLAAMVAGSERKESRRSTRPRGGDGTSRSVSELAELFCERSRVVVFTGAGVSVSSGLSSFTASNGLYEGARREFGLKNGAMLFHDRFFRKHRPKALKFLANMAAEADRATPSTTHKVLAELEEGLSRHVTLNVDGLFARTGADIWKPRDNPQGKTIEFHGNVGEVTCVACGLVERLSREQRSQMKDGNDPPCPKCWSPLRPRVMLYDDADGEHITPSEVWQVLQPDLEAADLVMWVGISFEQSASIEYFRRSMRLVSRSALSAVVNPSDDAMWNLKSAISNLPGGERLFLTLADSNTVFEAISAAREQQQSRATPKRRKHSRKAARIVVSDSSSEP